MTVTERASTSTGAIPVVPLPPMVTPKRRSQRDDAGQTLRRTFAAGASLTALLLVVAIIAVFYTDELHLTWFAAAVVGCLVWALLQRWRLRGWWLYLPLAVFVWWGVHESGVHATIAGMVLALLTRVRPDPSESASPAEHLEHLLSPISSNLAVPFFALLSAGGTKHYSELLAPFGLDASDPAFWQIGLSMIERLIGELEAMESATA